MNDVVKQSENNGGGFDKNPQNINKNGRPKKGQAITEILKDLLEQETDGITRKQKFAEKVLELALRGNESMIKLVWAYVDGSPVQKYEDKSERLPIPLLGGASDPYLPLEVKQKYASEYFRQVQKIKDSIGWEKEE